MSKATAEFGSGVGAERKLRGVIDDILGQNPEQTILIDTPGDLSLISNMSIAAAEVLVIPVATQLMSIDALSISLQRIGQIQQHLNSGLKRILILPSLFMSQRKTHKVSLQLMEKEFSRLMARASDGSLIVIEDRAEMDRFLHAHMPFKHGSPMDLGFKQLADCISSTENTVRLG